MFPLSNPIAPKRISQLKLHYNNHLEVIENSAYFNYIYIIIIFYRMRLSANIIIRNVMYCI